MVYKDKWAFGLYSAFHARPTKYTHTHTHQDASRQFDHIHVDLVGPLPSFNGYTHILTVVDRFTQWPEALLLKDTTAVSCAQALVFHWFARFGSPADLTSDRGPQITSQL